MAGVDRNHIVDECCCLARTTTLSNNHIIVEQQFKYVTKCLSHSFFVRGLLLFLVENEKQRYSKHSELPQIKQPFTAESLQSKIHTHRAVLLTLQKSTIDFVTFGQLVCCLFVVTPPLPRDGGTARTAIQVHTVNLIEIRLGERWQPISNQS